MISDKSDNKHPEISQTIYQETAADCFLAFERYRLKTHVVGINMEKDMLEFCYEALERRMTERYSMLYERLRAGLNGLYKNFTIAQATSLRTLNNIMRNYRRRVGTIGNQPLSQFKYNKFDKNEKMLLQSLIYNQKESYDQILKFQNELNIAMDQGTKQIQQKYKPSDKIKEDYKKILEVIDKTECYTFKYYDNFERSMLTTISTMQSYFDKLNGYLTVWENIGSIKAYEIKSFKEVQMDERISDYDSRRFFHEETEEKLQELISSCPPNSLQREEYQRRLNEVRHYNQEREKKLEMVGRMFNKRKNRLGILVNKRRQVTLLNWYFNSDGDKVNYNFQDQFKNYTAENQSNQFKPTQYQIQKPFKRQKEYEIRQHLQRYRESSNLNYQWWYDKFGKEGMFDLILCSSQQIQKRVEFEMVKQTELQATDDRRKRDFVEKQISHIKDAERRQSLHIGYLHPREKTEMELLQEKQFCTEYLPEILADDLSSSSIDFSDDDSFAEEKPIIKKQQIPNSQKQEYKKIEKIVLEQEKETAPDPAPFIKMGNKPTAEPQKMVNEQKIAQQPAVIEEDFDFYDACLYQQIIKTYFKEYSIKVLRRQDEPDYKKSKFLYYPELKSVNWEKLINYFECQKIFVMTKGSIVYMRRVFSVHKQKIKCFVYTLNEEVDEQEVKEKIEDCFKKVALVTIKFVSIYTELEEQTIPSFMIGLMLVLLKDGEMPQEYQNKDYIKKGRQIIEDFNYYFYPENYPSSKTYMKKVKPIKPNQLFDLSVKEQKMQQKKTKTSEFQEKNLLNRLDKEKSSEITLNQQKMKQQATRKKQSSLQMEQQKLQQQIKIQQSHKRAIIHEQIGELSEQAGLYDSSSRQMKRNNSRQNLNSYEVSRDLTNNREAEVQPQQEELDDYESL